MSRFKSSHPEHQIYEDGGPLRLYNDGVVVASGTGTIVLQLPGDCRGIWVRYFCDPLLVAGDTFDLYIQTLFTCSGVPVWVDAIHFEQILGDGLPVDLKDKIIASLDEGFFEIGTALAVDTQRNLIGEAWRCRWEVAGATPSFAFSVDIFPM